MVSQPILTDEELEELLSEIMMPENDSTIHNIRKRKEFLIRLSLKTTLTFLWTELKVRYAKNRDDDIKMQ